MSDFTDKQGAELIDGPIPGEGLTQDPENPQPWETAPEYTSLEEFIDDLFLNITNEDNIDGVLDPIRKGIPIEDVSQLLLFQAFSTGKITPDLMLSAIEPTMYMLMGLATFADVQDPVLYPEDDMIDEEEDEADAMLAAVEEGKPLDFKDLEKPKGISPSLFKKLEQGEINVD